MIGPYTRHLFSRTGSLNHVRGNCFDSLVAQVERNVSTKHDTSEVYNNRNDKICHLLLSFDHIVLVKRFRRRLEMTKQVQHTKNQKTHLLLLMTSLYHDATIDRTDKRRRTIGIENQHKSLHRYSGKVLLL